MMWSRIILLFILFLMGRHLGFPSSPAYLELADSADYFIARENWDKAEDKILKALRLEPANFTNSLLLSNLGMVQANKGEFSKALQSLTLGLHLAPSSTVILNNRAHTYLLTDSIEQAKKDLDRSLEIDSLQEWTLQTRAFLYLNQKDIESAEVLFRKLKENFTEKPALYTGLATIAQIQDKTEEAKTFYRQALKLDESYDEAREAFILLLINTGDYPAARIEIREALKQSPENPMFYLLRGYLHRLNYRMEEAQADKKLAISKGMDAGFASDFIP